MEELIFTKYWRCKLSDKTKDEVEQKLQNDVKDEIPQRCGIIMPISSMDGYPESHWKDIRKILTSAIEDAGFSARIVSESDDVGVIHQRIVQNLYDNPMIVCDISGRNANVMFELGLRLAFDKPTIIVKDDDTQYSFDTSVIEHLTYPKDLRYHDIESFKLELKERIEKTYATYLEDPSKYSTFLKNFGSFKVPEIEEKVLPINEYIIEELKSIRGNLDQLNLRSRPTREALFNKNLRGIPTIMEARISFHITKPLKEAQLKIKKIKQIAAANVFHDTNLQIVLNEPMQIDELESLLVNAGIKIHSSSVIKGIGDFDVIPF